MSRFLCLWIPHFAAWAALRSDPALCLPHFTRRSRPLLAHQNSRIVAFCPLAAQVGAEVGWTLARAQARFPEAVFWPVHGPTLSAAWTEVIASLLELTPSVESQRPGLLLADVRPAHLIPQILAPLLRQWHLPLGNTQCAQGVQGGVADDRGTAEVAAFTATAGTLRQVRPGHSAAFLRRVPCNVLSATGLRADTLQRLAWFGWRCIGDLVSLSRRQLQAQFDQGDLLFRYAQAKDQRPISYYRSPRTITATFTFETPVCEPYEWEAVLSLLIEKALSDLQLNHLQGSGAQTLTIQATTSYGLVRRHRLLPALTTEKRAFYEAAHQLLTPLLRDSLTAGGLPSLLHLGVTLGALQALPVSQGSLFGRKRPSVRVAVQAMDERFPGSLRRIVMLDRRAYLPETAFRLEPITLENLTPTNHEGGVAKRRKAPKGKYRKPSLKHSKAIVSHAVESHDVTGQTSLPHS